MHGKTYQNNPYLPGKTHQIHLVVKKRDFRMNSFILVYVNVTNDILYCRADTSMLVFEYAESHGLTGKDYIWFISPDGVAVRPAKAYPAGLLGESIL